VKTSKKLLLIHHFPVHPGLEPRDTSQTLPHPFWSMVWLSNETEILRIKCIWASLRARIVSGPFVELHFHCTCDPFLRLVDKGVEVGKEGVATRPAYAISDHCSSTIFLELQFPRGVQDDVSRGRRGAARSTLQPVLVVLTGFLSRARGLQSYQSFDAVLACQFRSSS
jgi:hypothetical protein